ncbi:hypothetical protein RSJ42_09570 [Methanosarcina hadiensis]|uniref:hypothetical protein n=1 Tax=Methanosarcina hadiensis TaxID=3078083 RepID=UPI0039775BCD
MQDTIEKFVQLATVTVENQKGHFAGPVENDVYQFSSLPWIIFTHISHMDFGNREKAQLIFDWGKYQNREGKVVHYYYTF